MLTPIFPLFPFFYGQLYASDCYTPIQTTLVFSGFWILFDVMFLILFEVGRLAPINWCDGNDQTTGKRVRRAAKKSRFTIFSTSILIFAVPAVAGLFEQSRFHAEGWIVPPLWRDAYEHWLPLVWKVCFALFFSIALLSTVSAVLRELKIEEEEEKNEKTTAETAPKEKEEESPQTDESSSH